MPKKYEKFYDIILDTIESMYYTIMTDADGMILFMSKNYRDLFHLTEKEVVGKYVADVIPNTRIPHVLKTGENTIGDIFEMVDGRKVICNRIVIKDDASQTLGVISSATFNTIEEIEQLNQKIEDQQRTNEQYKHKIQMLQSSKTSPTEIIGHSTEIQTLQKTIRRIAPTIATILITGETGTGKEIFANHVHHYSNRRDQSFVKINCAAIPKDLIESELFGYAPGAFSGALKQGKIGKFELANGGSILLDEIGEMPYDLQSKLLRVIQEKEIVRLGDNKTVKLDVRIICSTNKNLESLVRSGTFREDLYYRINVVELEIPPLRKRPEDIPPLADFFIQKFNITYGLGIHELSQEVKWQFSKYPWPGNVRELENVIERACLQKGSGNLLLDDFKFFSRKLLEASSIKEPLQKTIPSLENHKLQAEKTALSNALEQANGNKSQAAKHLGIDRSYLYTLIKKHQLD